MVETVKTLKKATLQLEGMSCASCAQTVEKALNKAKGVYWARVNIAPEKGTVDYNSSAVSREDLKKIVTTTGYGFEGFEGDKNYC